MNNKTLVIAADYGISSARLVQLLSRAGMSAEEATLALQGFAEAMEKPVRDMRGDVLLVDDFAAIQEAFKLRPPQPFPEYGETNFTPERPYGWYRQFEKKNGKRNKKV